MTAVTVTQASVETLNCTIEINSNFVTVKYSDGGVFTAYLVNFIASYVNHNESVVEQQFDLTKDQWYTSYYYKLLANDGTLVETVNNNSVVITLTSGVTLTSNSNGQTVIDPIENYDGDSNLNPNPDPIEPPFNKIIMQFNDPFDMVIKSISEEYPAGGITMEFLMSSLNGIYTGIGGDIITLTPANNTGIIEPNDSVDSCLIPVFLGDDYETLDDIFFNP